MHFKWYALGFLLVILAVGCGSAAPVSTTSRDDLLEFATTQSSIPGYWSDPAKQFGGQFNLKFTKVLTPTDTWKSKTGQKLCTLTGKGEIWEKGHPVAPFTVSGQSLGRQLDLKLTFADGTIGTAEGTVNGQSIIDASCVITFTYRGKKHLEDVFIASASVQADQKQKYYPSY